jgi:hypothetical protein
MASLRFRSYEPGAARKAGKVTAELWKAHRDQIEELYLIQKKPLKEVMRALEAAHGFRPT